MVNLFVCLSMVRCNLCKYQHSLQNSYSSKIHVLIIPNGNDKVPRSRIFMIDTCTCQMHYCVTRPHVLLHVHVFSPN